jgi:hypothetical protein
MEHPTLHANIPIFTNCFSGIVDGMAKNAKLPPIINATEMYLMKQITEVATDPGDFMNLLMQ